MIFEFIVLVTEYCIIPIALWVLPFFFKAIDSLRGSKRPSDVSEYGYEFILIESLCYLTFFLRTAFSHGLFDNNNNIVSIPSIVISSALFVYFMVAVFGFNKSIKFKTADAYRSVLFTFYWSLLFRVLIIFVYVYNSMVLVSTNTEFIYSQYKLYYVSAVYILLIYILFELVYKSVVEIFFIRWPRTMHEHNRLINNGSFSAAKSHCEALLMMRFLVKNRNTITGLSQAVRGYAESLIYLYMKSSNKNNLQKALKTLDWFSNNTSYITGGFFRASTIHRLRIFCYLELGRKQKAVEILNKYFSEPRYKILREEIVSGNANSFDIIGFIKKP